MTAAGRTGERAEGDVQVVRARVGEIGPLAAEYRRDASHDGNLGDQPPTDSPLTDSPLVETPLPSDGVYWIARDADGEALGYAAGTLRPEGFVLGPFFVRPAHRRQGIGRLLLTTIQRWADDEQVRLLEVAVAAGNHGGVRFLEAVGYRPTRVLMARPARVVSR